MIRLLCLIFFSLFSLYGCNEELETACAEANCAVSESKQSIDITFNASQNFGLGEFSVFSPNTFTTYDNDFSCSLPQELIDAGFSITPTCDVYGVPLKSLSGEFLITILDFETSQDKSVLVEINVTGGLGCNGYGNEVTIVDYPSVGSPAFSFCAESDQFIRDAASDLGIQLPGNGCAGTCTSSLAILELGFVDQSGQSLLDIPQIGDGYVLYDVAYPLSDLTLNLSPPPLI